MAQRKKRSSANVKRIPKRKNRRLLQMVLILLSCVILSCTLLYLKKGADKDYADKLAEKARLERLIAEEEAKTETISNYKAYVQTTSYIEEVAREVLGLVYKNEVIFKYEDKKEE